jgi:transposase-like protein
MARTSRYAREFRLQAAKMIVEQGMTFREAAHRVGVSPRSLRDWIGQFRSQGLLPPEGQAVPMAEELKAARKEMARLRMENEILKKAAAYFAKESL